MPKKKRNRWNNMVISEHLRSMRRMPTCSELRASGLGNLACAIARRGGFRHWAQTMGLAMKDSETLRGQRAEDVEEARLRGMGHDVVRQTTKAPFDLLVDGDRVDVKSARPGIYGNAKFTTYTGWIFRLAKVPATCDTYLLVCMDESGDVARRYMVPAKAAEVTMLTITPCGKYEQYRV